MGPAAMSWTIASFGVWGRWSRPHALCHKGHSSIVSCQKGEHVPSFTGERGSDGLWGRDTDEERRVDRRGSSLGITEEAVVACSAYTPPLSLSSVVSRRVSFHSTNDASGSTNTSNDPNANGNRSTGMRRWRSTSVSVKKSTRGRFIGSEESNKHKR